MPRRLQRAAGEEIDPYSTALFLDFDGTLVAIAEQPDKVTMRADTLRALEILAGALDGAVAVVSGRPVSELDAFLSPLKLPLAGVHGLEFQDPAGSVTRHGFDAGRLGALDRAVRDFAAPLPGLLVETKPGSVALHYRRRPDLASGVIDFARSMAAAPDGPDLVLGKMVAELRFGGRSKADAVSHFMDAPPFRGRTPWFFGDDVTDEDGFRRANALGGRSFRIGPGDTAADTSFAGFEAFQQWLVSTASRIGGKQARFTEQRKEGGRSTGTPSPGAVRATTGGA